MLGFLFSPAPQPPGVMAGVAGTLDAEIIERDGSLYVGFASAGEDAALAASIFLDLAGSPGPSGCIGATILADTARLGSHDLRARMLERLPSAAARAGRGRLIVTAEAVRQLGTSRVLVPSVRPAGEENFVDAGPLEEYGVSGRVAACMPPVRGEELDRLGRMIAGMDPRITRHAPGARVLAVLGRPSESARLVLAHCANRVLPDSPSPPRFHPAPTGGNRPADVLAPLLAGLSAEDPGTLPDSSPDRILAWNAVRTLSRAPWREGVSQEARIAVADALSDCLRHACDRARDAGAIPLALCLDADAMPAGSVGMLLEAAGNLGSEGPLLVLTGASLPPAVPFRAAAVFNCVGMPLFDSIQALRAAGHGDTASRNALAASQDSTRLGLIILAALRGATEPAGGWTRETPTADLLDAALATLPGAARDLLAHLARAAAIPSGSVAMETLAAAGYSRNRAEALLAFLERCGCPRRAALSSCFKEEKGPAAAVMAALLRDGRLGASLAASSRIAPARPAPGGEPSRFDLSCVDAEIESGDPEAPASRLPPVTAAWLSLRRAIAGESAGAIAEAAASLPSSGSSQGAIAALASAGMACAEYGQGRPVAAAAQGKASLLAMMGLGLEREDAFVQRLLGLCELAQGRIMQASGYFENSASLAEGAVDARGLTAALIAQTACMLLSGDFGHAHDLAGRAAANARRVFDPRGFCAALFAKGRAEAESGRYPQAVETFATTAALAARYSFGKAAYRASAWADRAADLSGEGRPLIGSWQDTGQATGENDAETFLFASEKAFRAGDMAEAARLSGLAAACAGARGIDIPIDRFSWQDGYTSLEGLYAGYGRSPGLLGERCLAWNLHCRAISGLDDPGEAALRIQALAREARIATPHPFAHLYLFWVYRLAAVTGAAGLDPSTTFSRAFKALQTRAGRLTDSALLEEYLHRNAENAEIVAEAGRRRSR